MTIIWADGAIQSQWLEVTALSAANGGNLGLVEDDVFYFGNMPGDASGDGQVSAGDLGILAGNWGESSDSLMPSAGDFNADGHVSAGDLGILAGNWGASLPELDLTTAPASEPLAAASDNETDLLASTLATSSEPAMEPAPAMLIAGRESAQIADEVAVVSGTSGVLVPQFPASIADVPPTYRPTVMPLGSADSDRLTSELTNALELMALEVF